MRRSPLKRSTTLTPKVGLTRDTPLRQMSDKARKRIPARRAAMAVVKERDRVCQFEPRLMLWAEQMEVEPLTLPMAEAEFMFTFNPKSLPECRLPMDGHEPKRRSHGADPTNPADVTLVCRGHHDWVDDHPLAAKALSL